MNTISNVDLLQDAGHSKALTKVLEQNEHIKELIENSADELRSVNAVLKQGLTDQSLPSAAEKGIENAIAKNDEVEETVREAAEKLSAVNLALESEVRDRNMLDHRFAALTEQEETARHAAFHDVLTGLANRALFYDRVEQGIAKAKRHRWALAVMFLDLDGFKIINDSHGHDAGDYVLQTIAQRLKENCRRDDTVCRLGGDEFLCLLNEAGDEINMAGLAEKFIRTIKVPCIFNNDGRTINVSVDVSIGIAIYPKDGTTVEMLIKNADTAMYCAKQNKSGYLFAQQSAPELPTELKSPEIGKIK